MNRYNYDGVPGTEYFVVSLSYSEALYEWGAPDEEFQAVLGVVDGAGTGFDLRDMDWAFADEASGIAAFVACRRVIRGRPGFFCALDVRVETESEDAVID